MFNFQETVQLKVNNSTIDNAKIYWLNEFAEIADAPCASYNVYSMQSVTHHMRHLKEFMLSLSDSTEEVILQKILYEITKWCWF